MKKLLAFILMLPFTVCAQRPNKSAPERKKNNVKELRYYEGANDSVPATTFYYDREGRMIKQIRIEDDSYDGSKWSVQIETYDSLGRFSKVETRYAGGTDLDEMQKDPARIMVTHWKYTGDTMSLRIDSSWRPDGTLYVRNAVTNVHWTKHPAPAIRPIFWQDSLCSKTFYQKSYEFHFAKPGDRFPGKIDSSIYYNQTRNFISNGKIYHTWIFRDMLDPDFLETETTEILTLNPVFDTITETRIIKHTPAFLRNHPGTEDKVEQRGLHYYETNRTGNRVNWINEIGVYGGNRFDYGKKQLENIWGFPEEDYSLSYYYEAWEYNSGDIEALTMRFYEKHYEGKSRKEFIYWKK